MPIKYRIHLTPLLLASSIAFLGVSQARSDDDAPSQRYVYQDLFGVESITEFITGVEFSPMFDGSGCDVDEPTVKNLVRLELQKDRGIKLRFVSSREFRERGKELNERPNKILEAGKKTIAEFLDRPEGALWKDAVKEANHYRKMPVLKFTVRTARVDQTCLAYMESKVTTYASTSARLVTVELWSDDRSVRVPQENFTAAIASAARLLVLQFIDDWKYAQASCKGDACRPSIANEE
jgi:hypothetical protein